MNLYKLKLLALLGLASMQSFAHVLPLDSVLGRIERNNPMLKMYDEQIKAATSFSKGAKSWMPPTLSTGPWQIPYKSFQDGMWMLTGEQMIPNPSKQKANFNYMQGMVSVEQQGKQAKKNEMFAMAKKIYYEWVILKMKHDVLVQIDSLLNTIVLVSRNRYTYNKDKLSNLYKAEADLFELRNMETMLLSDQRMKNVELNTLMNVDQSFVFEVDTALPSHSYELELPDTSLISASRSDIRQFDASIGLVKLQQELEKSKGRPDFGIAFSHMQSLGEMPNQYSAMGMISIPIAPWSSKEYKSSTRGLESTVQAINWQKQSLLNETAGMIISLQTQIKAAKQVLFNYRINIIPAYYKSYQASLLAYEQNTETLFVLLDGLKMLRMARMSELDQINALLILETEYEKAMEIR